MKFLKLIALCLALCSIFAFAVACDSGEDASETTKAAENSENPDGSNAPSNAYKTKRLLVTVLNEEGDEEDFIDEEDFEYLGAATADKITVFEILKVYCEDAGIPCTFDDTFGFLVSIGDYTVDENTQWVYEVNGKELTDYDAPVAADSRITITMQKTAD